MGEEGGELAWYSEDEQWRLIVASPIEAIKELILKRIPADVDTLDKYRVWLNPVKASCVPSLMSDSDFESMTVTTWHNLHPGS